LFFALRINQVISKSNLPSYPFEFAKAKKEEEGDEEEAEGGPTKPCCCTLLHSLEKTATFADSFIPITLFLLQSW
jgi:hypothetical protein